MNLNRAIGGFLLSFVFLAFFMYAISGVKWVLGDSLNSQNDKLFLGSVSDAVQNVSPQIAEQKNIQPADAPADPLEVNATSAISVESDLQNLNKNLLLQNSDAVLPIASLTKLMTAVVVLDNYNLSDMAVVDAAADSQDPMKTDVKLGDKLPVESLLDIMLIESSNKSAYALSELIGEPQFVGLMNQKAKSLGLNNTFFADPTGLSPKDVSSAADLAKLAIYILKNYPKISDISKMAELSVPGFGTVENTDELVGEFPEVVCSKTGYTVAANGCLLLVINNPKNNDYLINVVLGADDRFGEMKKIINWSVAACN